MEKKKLSGTEVVAIVLVIVIVGGSVIGWLTGGSSASNEPTPTTSPVAARPDLSTANRINEKLQNGIVPSNADIDSYTSDPQMRAALKAFYGNK